MTLAFREEYLKLLQLVKNNSPKHDIKLVKKAFEFALQTHKGNKRLSGEPFFSHPLAVALILAEWGLDSETISAGLLHDCITNARLSGRILRKEFGGKIAALVGGATNLHDIATHSVKERDIKNLQMALLASVKDLRVIIITLADRLHNLRTIDFLPSEKKKEYAEFSLEVYSPLAHNLSMHDVFFEIQDLAFKALYPSEFDQLIKQSVLKKKTLEKTLSELSRKLKTECLSAGIPLVLQRQSKSFYPTWSKIKSGMKIISEVNDFEILDVLTNNVDDCYRILGKIHSIFKPVPRKFKDYIANPENGLYQALHTTVISPDGIQAKCYVSTFEMHSLGNQGIVYLLKNPSQKNNALLREKTIMFQKLSSPKLAKSPQEFVEKLSSELIPSLFVLTPKGKKIELPVGSNSIDFAYAVHTELGDHCLKSVINGVETPIERPLNAGDTVSIITSKKLQASKKWLSSVKSRHALAVLRLRFKKH